MAQHVTATAKARRVVPRPLGASETKRHSLWIDSCESRQTFVVASRGSDVPGFRGQTASVPARRHAVETADVGAGEGRLR